MAKYPKHLSVEQSEVAKILVGYELNKFVAYVQLQNGSSIVFLSGHDYDYINQSEEFRKYLHQWHLPVEFSDMAHSKKIEEFTE